MSNGSGQRELSAALSGAGSGAAMGTAIAPGLGTAIGAGGGALFGYIMSAISEAENAGDMEKAQQLRDQALQLIDKVNVPNAYNFQSQTMGPSAMNGVQTDGALSSQIQQLIASVNQQANAEKDPLQQQAYTNAFRGADRQAYNQMQDANAQAARRGINGSGVQMAALLSANENGANAVANAGMSAASDLYQRRFNALRESLSAQQQQQGQALGLAENRANATDRISQFNANQNWQAQIQNAQQQQQAYQNQMAKTQAQQAAMLGRADAYGANVQNNRNAMNQGVQNLMQGANAAITYANAAPKANDAAGAVAVQQPLPYDVTKGAAPMDNRSNIGWDW